MKHTLSVIIPSFNTATITLKCIKTINKFLPQAEIIVVDNASTDNTVKLLSTQKVKLVINPSNLGFAKACNIGARLSTKSHLLFLNSDIELFDSSLLDMLKFLHTHPQIGAIGPQFLNPDGSIQASVFPPQTIINAFKQYWLNQPAFIKYYPSTNKPVSVWAISGGAILIKTSLFKRLDGWNEKYFMYFEDLDLCRRLRLLNKQIYYYPQAKLIHRHGASGKSLADSQNQWRRLIPSSKKYHGLLTHAFINLIIKTGQKLSLLTK